MCCELAVVSRGWKPMSNRQRVNIARGEGHHIRERVDVNVEHGRGILSVHCAALTTWHVGPHYGARGRIHGERDVHVDNTCDDLRHHAYLQCRKVRRLALAPAGRVDHELHLNVCVARLDLVCILCRPVCERQLQPRGKRCRVVDAPACGPLPVARFASPHAQRHVAMQRVGLLKQHGNIGRGDFNLFQSEQLDTPVRLLVGRVSWTEGGVGILGEEAIARQGLQGCAVNWRSGARFQPL
eukprot:7388300-Prymnesium_polylepis.1